MSAEAAAKVALLDAPGYLDVKRAQAALWLLDKLHGDHLPFPHEDQDDIEDWCRSIVKDAIRDSLTAAETRIADSVKAAAPPAPGVVPIQVVRGEPVTHGEREADCPVCGMAILRDALDVLPCDRCGTAMHDACYFGRVATLAEFQEHRRQIASGPENYAPDVVCAQCRAAKGEGA